MESFAYTSEDTSVRELKPDEKKRIFPFPLTGRKRIIFWSVIGVFFFLLYTGGTYYIFFANKSVEQTPVVPNSTAPSPTPAPPTPTAVPTVTPAVVNTDFWRTYTNKTYQLSVDYPQYFEINFNETEEGKDPYLIILSYPNASPSGLLTINVQDISYIGQSDTTSRDIINSDIITFAKKKRDLNFTNSDPNDIVRGVSPLYKTEFLNKTAYLFTVSGSYYDDREYQVLPEEYTYLVTQNGSYKVMISYPTGDSLLKKISETIQFL